jgi:ribosome-binding protein aMBF1 (putative translation factor)
LRNTNPNKTKWEMKSMDRIFCERLKACRVAAGLSQKELAYRLGTDFQVVSLYERGGIMPGIEAIRKFAEALGVSAGYLVDRMPPRHVDVCPCCGAKLEPQKGGVRYELPRVSGAEN